MSAPICPGCNHIMADVAGTEGAAVNCKNPCCAEYARMLCSKCGRPWDTIVSDGPNRHRLAPSCTCWEKKHPTWDERFVGLATHIAQWSKDESTKVGCVLVQPETRAVVGLGFNGFARGVEEHSPDRWARPTKYLYSEHAERNAIYNAARLGHPTNGTWAYLNWNPTEGVCSDCARALIQAGIVCVVGPSTSPQERPDIRDDGGWRNSCQVGLAMLREAVIEVRVVATI